MLTAVGYLVDVICLPLNQMGHLLSMSLADYYQQHGDETMSVVVFDVAFRPWVENAGHILVGGSAFLSDFIVACQALLAALI